MARSINVLRCPSDGSVPTIFLDHLTENHKIRCTSAKFEDIFYCDQASFGQPKQKA